MASGPCAMRPPYGLAAANCASTWIGVKSPTSQANRLMSPSPIVRPGVTTRSPACSSVMRASASSRVSREFGFRQRLAVHLVGPIADAQEARLREGFGEEEIL